MLRRTLLPIIAAGIWIAINEFVRNELLLKSIWTTHYESLELTFPAQPLNAAIWAIWSFLFAGLIFLIGQRNNILATTFMAWVGGFVLMWTVTFNMLVLPLSILMYAIPLSLFETFFAAWIIERIKN